MSASVGVSPVVPQLTLVNRRPTSISAFDQDAQVWRSRDNEVCAVGRARGEQCTLYFPPAVSFDWSCRDGDVHAHSDTLQPLMVEDLYLRTVLPLVRQTQGHQSLHGSAIKTSNGVVAFCAPSTTGKSTLAVALRQRGYQLWADDAVSLEAKRDDVVAIPLPFRARLRSASCSALNEVVQQEWLHYPDTALLSAICVLQRTSQGPLATIRRLTAGEAFRQLIEHAYWFVLPAPESKRRMMQHYLTVAAKVGIFEVRFKPDLRRIDDLVDAIEEQIIRAVVLA